MDRSEFEAAHGPFQTHGSLDPDPALPAPIAEFVEEVGLASSANGYLWTVDASLSAPLNRWLEADQTATPFMRTALAEVFFTTGDMIWVFNSHRCRVGRITDDFGHFMNRYWPDSWFLDTYLDYDTYSAWRAENEATVIAPDECLGQTKSKPGKALRADELVVRPFLEYFEEVAHASKGEVDFFEL